MKFKLFLCFALCFLFMGCDEAVNNDVDIIKERDIPERIVLPSVDNFETTLVKNLITQDELKADLDDMCYILEAGYAGYDDAVERGFNPDEFKADVLNHFDAQVKISSDDFASYMAEYLSAFVKDRHFAIIGKNNRVYRPMIPSKVFMSNIFVKEIDGKFVVIASDIDSVKEGDVYSGAKENLFYYPSKGEGVFRFGSIFEYDKSFAEGTINVNGKNEEFYLEHFDESLYGKDLTDYSVLVSDNSVYVYLPSLKKFRVNDSFYEQAEEIYADFASVGSRYSDKDFIIIDLRTNGGGTDSYYEKFLISLSGCSNVSKFLSCLKDVVELSSPLTISAWTNFYKTKMPEEFNNPSSIHNICKLVLGKKTGKAVECKWKKNDSLSVEEFESAYKGKIIVLIGKETASSAESSLFWTKKLYGENCILVGENSCGALNYANMFNYVLPNSRIGIYAGATKYIYNSEVKVVDGLGFMPDVWSTSDDMADTIGILTSDEQMKKFFDNEVRMLVQY